MFNNIFQITLTCSSTITYLSSLILLFNISPAAEQIEVLLLGHSPNEQPLKLFISIVTLLILPDFLAIISYGNSRKNNPEINQQPSAGFRILVDLILIAPIIWFLYNHLFTPVQRYQNYTSSQTFTIQLCMGAALALSFASLALFQPLHFLRHIRSEEETQEYFKSLIDKPPYINFHVHAYHYEWRTRWITETYTDSRGRTKTRTRPERYREQVTTLRHSKPYVIPSWQDTTNLHKLLEPQQFRITKIKISTTIRAADASALKHYNQAWSDFRDKYKTTDTQVDFSTSKGIRGMGPTLLLSFLNLEERSIFLNVFFCFLISLTPFAWGYSLWLDQMSSVTEKIISKEYSLSE